MWRPNKAEPIHLLRQPQGETADTLKHTAAVTNGGGGGGSETDTANFLFFLFWVWNKGLVHDG